MSARSTSPATLVDAMVGAGVREQLPALALQFQRAQPFRHAVIDDFFEAGLADSLLAEFPAFDPARAVNENGEIGNKAVFERIRALGPSYARLDDLVRSAPFLELVSALTGIPGLLYDPHYFGGGTHDNRQGQGLDAHVDFNRHPVTHSHRRLNLIVYLNRQWQADWGGVLELHRDPRADDDQVTRVLPGWNRAVVFETTESSWHGFSPISLPAEEASRSRRSIALYFYTRERPPAELAATHSTIYVNAPLPTRFAAGRVLSDADVSELRQLLKDRDQHIQRLYGEAQATQARLDSSLLKLGLERGSRLYRLLLWIRRTAAGS